MRCTGMAMHFWDATDDLTDVNMDLLLEGERLYFHNATGRFGAVPLVLTGDFSQGFPASLRPSLAALPSHLPHFPAAVLLLLLF